ncbi:MAG: DUF503 domain-containing protein [Phycisphaerales bacterium JB039]
MVIGALEIEVIVAWSESLKDKRRVIRSLKDRLHREHMVSVSEIGEQDSLRRARIGVVCVGADGRRVGETLDRVARKVTQLRDAEVGILAREVFRAADVPADRRTGTDQGLEEDLLTRGQAALETDPEGTP